MRGAPHRGFAAAIFLTRVVISASTGGRPAVDRPDRWSSTRGIAALPSQHGVGRHDDESLPPAGPDSGQPDPQQAILRAQPRPGRHSLVDGELLAQGQVLEGELTVAADEEREEPKQVEHEGDHRPRLWPDQGRQINHLRAGRVLARDREESRRCGRFHPALHRPRRCGSWMLPPPRGSSGVGRLRSDERGGWVGRRLAPRLCRHPAVLRIVFGVLLVFVGIVGTTALAERMRFGQNSGGLDCGGCVRPARRIGRQPRRHSLGRIVRLYIPKQAFVATATAVGVIVDVARVPIVSRHRRSRDGFPLA